MPLGLTWASCHRRDPDRWKQRLSLRPCSAAGLTFRVETSFLLRCCFHYSYFGLFVTQLLDTWLTPPTWYNRWLLGLSGESHQTAIAEAPWSADWSHLGRHKLSNYLMAQKDFEIYLAYLVMFSYFACGEILSVITVMNRKIILQFHLVKCLCVLLKHWTSFSSPNVQWPEPIYWIALFWQKADTICRSHLLSGKTLKTFSLAETHFALWCTCDL